MNKIRSSISKVVDGFNYVGMAICFIMVFVVSIDVILRKVSGQRLSIAGSNEFSSYFLIVMCMLAIPMFQIKKGHVWVNMFVDMLPSKLRSVWLGIVLFVETVISAALCYGSVNYTIDLMANGRATDILNLPWWPFALITAFGFLELTVLLLIDTIQCFIDAKNGGEKKEEAAE